MTGEWSIFELAQKQFYNLKYTFQIVGIWEGACHNEVLEAYVHHASKISAKIVLFTHAFQWEQAEAWRHLPNLDWVIKDKTTKWVEFFSRQNHMLRSLEWLITTSLPDHPEDTDELHFPCPAWLVIHNAMYSLGQGHRKFYMGRNFVKDTLKIFRYQISNDKVKHQQCLAAFENIIFPSTAVREYCQKLGLIKSATSAVIPFYYQKKVIRNISTTRFTLVVPGSVHPDIRDYGLLAEILPDIIRKALLPVTLVFLGKIKDKSALKWIKKIKKLESGNFQFQYFYEFIPQDLFEKYMGEADLVVAPLHKETRYDAIEERFGFTTESGNVADIISCQLPGVVPAFYPLPAFVQNNLDRYRDAPSLTEIILEKIRLKTGNINNKIEINFPDISDSIIKQWHDFRSLLLVENHD